MFARLIFVVLFSVLYQMGISQTEVSNSEIRKTEGSKFDNLSVGDFSKDGDTRDGLFNKDNRIFVELNEGEHDQNNDFVQQKISTISGSVLEDSDNDNIGDKGIPGVVIRLFDQTGKPALDINGIAVRFQITDENGYYRFDNLKPGNYIVMKPELDSNKQNENSGFREPYVQRQQAKKNGSKLKDRVQNILNPKQKSQDQEPIEKSSHISFQDIVDNKVKTNKTPTPVNRDLVSKNKEEKESNKVEFELPVDKNILLVGSSLEKGNQAFLPFKMNFGNYLYETIHYPSHKQYGTGYNVEMQLPELINYEMIFIKLDLGSFSENMLDKFAEYIELGGKIYFVFDAYDKPHYLDRMQTNFNELLKRLKIDDTVLFSHELVDMQNKSGLMRSIDNVGRQKKDEKTKVGDFRSELTYLSTMGKGYYLKAASDLSETNRIFRFEIDRDQYITNAFWSLDYGGGIGIGTEKQTSAYSEYGTLDAWKMIANGFNLK